MGGRRSTKVLDILNQSSQVFEKKTFTQIEVHAGMAERLMRDLTIEEALREQIKDTQEHNNQSYGEWCDQKEEVKT